jgi:hypothetical protein
VGDLVHQQHRVPRKCLAALVATAARVHFCYIMIYVSIIVHIIFINT